MRRYSMFALVLLVGVAAQAADRVPIKPWWSSGEFAGEAAVEQSILELINGHRAKAKLKPLEVVDQLRTAARQHSAEMLREQYFAHESPHAGWKNPADRAYRAGYWEAYVGENVIIYTSTADADLSKLAEVMVNGANGWMNSPGHRANILSTDYTETGIGVSVSGGKAYGTQVFGRRYWDVTEPYLLAKEGAWELGGKAKLLAAVPAVYVGLDDDVYETLKPKVGQTVEFTALIPVDGKKHRYGLHPSKGGDSYWLKFLFYVDTNRDMADARLMPFD
ncbi:MAG: CAP domain-containing protein [Armatimonadetes bacterium]|nr:CAP domain-containing protein [Armatimonadota bacterium]